MSIIKVPYKSLLLSIIICHHLSLTYHTQKHFIKAFYYLATTWLSVTWRHLSFPNAYYKCVHNMWNKQHSIYIKLRLQSRQTLQSLATLKNGEWLLTVTLQIIVTKQFRQWSLTANSTKFGFRYNLHSKVVWLSRNFNSPNMTS